MNESMPVPPGKHKNFSRSLYGKIILCIFLSCLSAALFVLYLNKIHRYRLPMELSFTVKSENPLTVRLYYLWPEQLDFLDTVSLSRDLPVSSSGCNVKFSIPVKQIRDFRLTFHQPGPGAIEIDNLLVSGRKFYSLKQLEVKGPIPAGKVEKASGVLRLMPSAWDSHITFHAARELKAGRIYQDFRRLALFSLGSFLLFFLCWFFILAVLPWVISLVPSIRKNRKLSLVFICLTFFAMLLWFSYWAMLDINQHHDGILLKPALDFAEGKVPYKETFMQYGFLMTVIQGAACWIFGGKVIVIRLLTALFYAGSGLLLYLISKKLMKTFFCWFPVAVFVILAPFYYHPFFAWSSVYAMFFTLLLCYFIIPAEGEAPFSMRKSFWLGVLSAIPFFFRQPCGLTIPAAGLVLFLYHWYYRELFKETWKRLSFFCTGTVLPFLLFLIYLVSAGALHDFLIQSIQFAAKFGVTGCGLETGTDNPFFAFCKLMVFVLARLAKPSQPFYLFLTLLVLSCGIVILHAVFIKKKDVPLLYWQALAVVLIALVSFLQFYPVCDISHFFWGGAPGFLIYGVAADCLYRRFKAFPKKMTFFFAVLLFPLLWEAAWRPFLFINHFTWPIRERPVPLWNKHVCFWTEKDPLQYLFLTRKKADLFKKLKKAVAKLPPEYRNRIWVNLTPDGLFCLFFPNHNNWSPMYVNWGNLVYDNYTETLAEYLKTGKNGERPVVFLDPSSPYAELPLDGYRLHSRVPWRLPVYDSVQEIQILLPEDSWKTPPATGKPQKRDAGDGVGKRK